MGGREDGREGTKGGAWEKRREGRVGGVKVGRGKGGEEIIGSHNGP